MGILNFTVQIQNLLKRMNLDTNEESNSEQVTRPSIGHIIYMYWIPFCQPIQYIYYVNLVDIHWISYMI